MNYEKSAVCSINKQDSFSQMQHLFCVHIGKSKALLISVLMANTKLVVL